MKRRTLGQRLRYGFDNLMSKGTASLLLILGVITTAVDFYTLGASASRYNEIAIGHKKFSENGSFTIEINPKSREATMFSDRDELIVIAKNAA